MELRKYLSVFRNTQEEKKRKKKRFSSYSGVEEAEEEEEEEEEDLLVGDAYRRLYCAGRRLFLMVFLRFSPRCFNSWTLTTQLSHNPLKDLLLLLLLLTAQRKYKAERWKPTTTTTKTHEHNHNHNHNNQSINESKMNQHDFRKNHFFPIAGGFSD